MHGTEGNCREHRTTLWRRIKRENEAEMMCVVVEKEEIPHVHEGSRPWSRRTKGAEGAAMIVRLQEGGRGVLHARTHGDELSVEDEEEGVGPPCTVRKELAREDPCKHEQWEGGGLDASLCERMKQEGQAYGSSRGLDASVN